MSVNVSRKLEARCCGVARFLPSHGFGALRQMQNAVVLSTLWLITDQNHRAGVLMASVVTVAALTHALHPYTLQELNRLDLQTSVAVTLHITLLLSAPSSAAASIVVAVVHLITAMSLCLSILRGASSNARQGIEGLRVLLERLLPQLRDVRVHAGHRDGQPDGVLASSLPSAMTIARAMAARAGCSACKAASSIKNGGSQGVPPSHTAPSSGVHSGANQWLELARMAAQVAAQPEADLDSALSAASALMQQDQGSAAWADRRLSCCARKRADVALKRKLSGVLHATSRGKVQNPMLLRKAAVHSAGQSGGTPSKRPRGSISQQVLELDAMAAAPGSHFPPQRSRSLLVIKGAGAMGTGIRRYTRGTPGTGGTRSAW